MCEGQKSWLHTETDLDLSSPWKHPPIHTYRERQRENEYANSKHLGRQHGQDYNDLPLKVNTNSPNSQIRWYKTICIFCAIWLSSIGSIQTRCSPLQLYGKFSRKHILVFKHKPLFKNYFNKSCLPWKCIHYSYVWLSLWGWSGVAKVSCILRHWGVQLILAYSWAKPAILVAGKGRGGMFLFLLFLHLYSFPLSSLSLSFISPTISSISFLPFSGRWHKMTHKGWGVVNQSIIITSLESVSLLLCQTISEWFAQLGRRCIFFKQIIETNLMSTHAIWFSLRNKQNITIFSLVRSA